MKSFLKALLLSVCVASYGFAQENEGVEKSPEVATMDQVSAAASNDLVFAVSVHPITMIVYSMVLDIPSLFVTLENPIASRMSLITRPAYMGKEWSSGYETVDLDLFGISEGIRYYFNRGHRGYFCAFHFEYDYVSIEHEIEYKSLRDKESVSGNAISLGFYFGGSSKMGHFTTSWDVGVTYREIFAGSDSDDDVEEVTSVGVGLDLNYTIGFAL